MHDIRYTIMVGALLGVFTTGLLITGDLKVSLLGALPSVIFAFGLVGEAMDRLNYRRGRL
jgi:hypothetical protein